MQTVNLSANEVLEHLNITLPASWSAEANEIDTVCFDHKDVGLGYIVTLNICPCKGYSFTVHEFVDQKQAERDYENTDEFLTYDEALAHIRARVDMFSAPASTCFWNRSVIYLSE